MTKPETKWVAVEPGVLILPTTKFVIRYVAGSMVPFRVTWNDKEIPSGTHMTLARAQEAAETHMAELIVMGYEV